MLAWLSLASPLLLLLARLVMIDASSGPARFELKFQNDLDNTTIHKVETQQQILKCQVKLASVNQSAEPKSRLKSSTKLIEADQNHPLEAKWPANVYLAIDWFKDEQPIALAFANQVAVINVELARSSNSGGVQNDKKDAWNSSENNNSNGGSGSGNKNKSRVEIKNTLNGQQMKLTSRLKFSQLTISDSGRYKCVSRASFQVPIISGSDQVKKHQLILVEQGLDSNGFNDLVVAHKSTSTNAEPFQAGRRGAQGAGGKLQLRERTRNNSNRSMVAALAPGTFAGGNARNHHPQKGNDTQHEMQVHIGANHEESKVSRPTDILRTPEGSIATNSKELNQHNTNSKDKQDVNLESLRRRQQQQGSASFAQSPSGQILAADDEDLFKLEQQQQQQEIISNQLQLQQQLQQLQSFTSADSIRPSSNDEEDQDEELSISTLSSQSLSRRRHQSGAVPASGEDLSGGGHEWAAPSQPSSGNDIQADDINNSTGTPINQSSAQAETDDDGMEPPSLVIGLRRNTPEPRNGQHQQQSNLKTTTTNYYAPFGSAHKGANSHSMDGGNYFSGSLDSTRLRLAKLVRKIATDELSCYTGYGEHYRGNVSTSADKRPCLSWLQVRRILGPSGFQRNLAKFAGATGRDNFSTEDSNHNHCRNPNLEPLGPWCFVQFSEDLDANMVGEHFVLVSATHLERNTWWNSTSEAKGEDKQRQQQIASIFQASSVGATRYVQRACSISPCSDYLWLYIVAPPFGLLAVLSCLIFIMIRALRKSRYQSMMMANGKKTLPSKLNRLIMGSSRLGAQKKSSYKSSHQLSGRKKTKTSCPNYLDDDIFEIVNDIDWSDGSQTGDGQPTSGRQLSACKSINPLFNDKALNQQQPRISPSHRSTTTTQVGPMFATLRCHIRKDKEGQQASTTSTFIENNSTSIKPAKQPTNADWLTPSSPDSDSSPETSGVAMDFSSCSKQISTGSHLIPCSNTTDDIEAIDCCGEKYIKASDLRHLDASSISVCVDQQQLYEGKFSQVQLAYLKQLNSCGDNVTDRDIGAQVAICSLKPNSAHVIDPKLFKPMNLKLRNLNHLNLLKLIGYSHIAQNEIGINQSPRLSVCCSLVFDMARLVDLNDWLKQQNKDLLMGDEPAGELGLRRNLTCFAKQIALAMDYLHDINIVYKDLTCRNCFLDPTKMLVKLSSFNLEFVVQSSDQHAQNLKSMIRPKYLHDYYVIDSRPSDCQLVSLNCIPLESILFNKFNKQTDVWSFGCLIYELFSFGEAAYFGYSSKQVIDSIRANLMPPQPLLCPNGIYKLMCKCLSDIPNSRPNVKQIYEQLNLYSGQCSSFLDHHLCSLATNMYDDKMIGPNFSHTTASNGGLMNDPRQNMCNSGEVATLNKNTRNLFIATNNGAKTSSRNNSITKTKSYANIKHCSSPQNKSMQNYGLGLDGYENQAIQSRPEFAKIPLSKSINLGTGSRLTSHIDSGAQHKLELKGNHYDEPVV